MRIAFVVEGFDAARGGMERSACELVRELVAIGIQVTVVTQASGRDDNWVEVRALGKSGGSRASRYRAFIRQVESEIERLNADVVHSVAPCLRCDVYQPRSGIIAESIRRTIAARRTGVGRLMRWLGARLDSKTRLLLELERHLLGPDSKVTLAALSGSMAERAQREYGARPELTRVIFNGVTLPAASSDERAEARREVRRELALGEAPVALFVGHNFRRKGLLRAIESLALPAAEGWRLIVAGKDDHGPAQRRAEQYGVRERIRFCGARTDVRRLYLASDLGVLPTYYDPCARTVLEGLSLGLPFVTTRFDGAADAIVEGENGFVLASPDDAAGLGKAMLAMRDAAVRKAMSERAQADRNKLSMRRHAEELGALYETVALTR